MQVPSCLIVFLFFLKSLQRGETKWDLLLEGETKSINKKDDVALPDIILLKPNQSDILKILHYTHGT